MSDNTETKDLKKEDQNTSSQKDESNHNSEEKMYSASGEPLMSAEEYTQYQQMTDGWSWAGAMLTFVVLIVGRRWGLLVFWVISMFIPYINFIATIGWLIYGGLNGKKIIYNSQKLINKEEKQGAIKALEMGGFGTFLLWIVGFAFMIMIVFGIIAGVTFFSFGKF